MSPSNPYRDWLGIGPDVGNPNLYQLLGLGPANCAEKKNLLEAANRQLAKLRPFKSTENHAAIQRLVEEIKSAAKCLANADFRNEYNAKLLNTAMLQSSKSQDKFPSAIQPTKLSVQAIPAAIPLAIPVDEPTQKETDGESIGNRLSTFDDVNTRAELEIELLANVKPRKPRSALPLVLSVLMTLVALAGAAVVFRPAWRENLFGTAPISSDLPKTIPIASEVYVQPNIGATPTNETGIVGPNDSISSTNDSITNPPPMLQPPSIEPAKSELLAETPPAQVAPILKTEVFSVIDPPRQPAIPDSAVDFYERSIVAALAANDIDAAVDLYSRLDSEAISDQRMDLFLRLATIANSYTLYRERLLDSAERIPGGTSLEIGTEKLTIGIVEASREFMILRDRGVNYRYPLELVPSSICWAVIEQMQVGDPLVPILKPLEHCVKHWEQPPVIEQAIAEATAYNPPDSVCQQTKEAVLAWLQTDRAFVLGDPRQTVDLRDARFTEAMNHVAALPAAAEHSEDAIHECVRAAFLEGDPMQRLARLQFARNVAVEQCNVALAVYLNMEIARSLNPEAAQKENVNLIQELGNKNLDRDKGSRLLVYILQLVNNSDKPLDQAQVQTVLRVASGIVAKLKLDVFFDAIQRAASRK